MVSSIQELCLLGILYIVFESKIPTLLSSLERVSNNLCANRNASFKQKLSGG